MSDDKFCIKDLTTGQLNALVKKIGRDNVPGILDGTLGVVVSKPPKLSVLGIQSKVMLSERTDRFDPNKFFQPRNGLCVWVGFKDRILPVTKEVQSLPAREISSFPLVKSATDSEIRGELPEGHVFQDASAFCAYLAGMIKKQANGEEGDLLANGYANVFYVVGKNGEVFTVYVRWFSGNRKWDVNAWPLVDSQWLAGPCAFSATAGA